MSSDDKTISERVGLMDLQDDVSFEAMTHPDFFLVNGCHLTDDTHGFDFILGNYNLFAFDQQKITFTKIEY